MRRWSATLLLALLLLVPHLAFAEKWGFAVIADNRSAFPAYRNVLEEIKGQTVNPAPQFPPAEFILACGDLSPMAENEKLYRSVFTQNAPCYLPVRGNHENADDLRLILKEILPSYGEKIHRHDESGVNYYLDWKNVRLIVLDQYSDFARSLRKEDVLRWLDGVMRSATQADHIFIAFHEPYFPEESREDPFWRLLVEHHDKVRAVFAGHYHSYDRKRIPNERGGICYINAGNAGWVSHSDRRQTVVEVMVDGKTVTFRTVQAPNGSKGFTLKEQWNLQAPLSKDLKNPPAKIGSPAGASTLGK